MRPLLRLGLALAAVLLASGCDKEDQVASRSEPSSAPGSTSATPSTPPSASAGILDASWAAPTTNTDGSPLTDLASYRVYYGTASTPCPGLFFVPVVSPTSKPQINETVTVRLTGLSAGARYSVAITAVDSGGIESACSSAASATARGNTANQLVGNLASTGASGAMPFATQAPVSTLTGLTADPSPGLPVTTVTFTATAAGGTAPYQFKWWLWDGAVWTVLVDWSSGNTFAWTPSAPNANYTVGVWVRSAGNAADQPDGYPANTTSYGTIPFAIN